MKNSLIIILYFYSSAIFAADSVQYYRYLDTGIPWKDSSTCLKHNVQRVCFEEDISFVSCQAPTEADETNATIAKCSTMSGIVTPYSQNQSECKRIQKKYITPGEICNFPQEHFDPNSSLFELNQCYGQDVRDYRQAHCPAGCADMPKFHVCDWTQDQYDKYKNCGAVQFITQTVRETLCPTGRPDVTTDGPPPRYSIVGIPGRFTDRQDYLSYKNFRVILSGINLPDANGTIYGKYCFRTLSDDPNVPDGTCANSGTNHVNVWKNLTADDLGQFGKKYIIKSYGTPGGQSGVPMGKYELKIKRMIPLPKKEISIEIRKAPLTPPTVPSPTGGFKVWAELIGPELSPVIPKGNNPTTYYTTPNSDPNNPNFLNTGGAMYREEKDATGRRWKLMWNTEVEMVAGGGSTPPPEPPCTVYEGDYCDYSQTDSNGNPLFKKKSFYCDCGKMSLNGQTPFGFETNSSYNTSSMCWTNDNWHNAHDHCGPPQHNELHRDPSITNVTPTVKNQLLNTTGSIGYLKMLLDQTLIDDQLHLRDNLQFGMLEQTAWRQTEATAYSDWHAQHISSTPTSTTLPHPVINYGGSDIIVAECDYDNAVKTCGGGHQWYAILQCTGGATPDTVRNGVTYTFEPFVEPGQFIWRPTSGNQCLCTPGNPMHCIPANLDPVFAIPEGSIESQ